MKSTGEVMGIDSDFGTAFAKSQTAAYGSPALQVARCSCRWPTGTSVRLVFPVKRLADLGLSGWLATEGTAEMLRRNGIPCEVVRKNFEEPSPQIGRRSQRWTRSTPARSNMVINTPYGNSGPRIDGYEIRSAAVATSIPCVTTVQGASAAVQGIEAGIRGESGCARLQELHASSAAAERWPGRRPAELAARDAARGPSC